MFFISFFYTLAFFFLMVVTARMLFIAPSWVLRYAGMTLVGLTLFGIVWMIIYNFLILHR